MADHLHQAGFTISAPLLPGHGTNPADLNRVTWQDWLGTAEKALAELQERCGLVFVGGESMGGLLALMLAQSHPEIKGLLLFAPAVINHKLFFTPLLKHFVKFSKKRKSDDFYEWQGYQVNPVAGAAELYALQRATVKGLKSVNQPVIIFQGRNDHTVSASGARKVYEKVSTMDKELIWYDCGHGVLLEKDFDDAASRSKEFIKRILTTK
ncbi:MAG: alpha/beta hydrolase [Anaerolineaceae bacterium]